MSMKLQHRFELIDHEQVGPLVVRAIEDIEDIRADLVAVYGHECRPAVLAGRAVGGLDKLRESLVELLHAEHATEDPRRLVRVYLNLEEPRP